MSIGAKATLALWVAAITWDTICADNQTISEALARGVKDPHTRIPITSVLVMSITHIFALAWIARKTP